MEIKRFLSVVELENEKNISIYSDVFQGEKEIARVYKKLNDINVFVETKDHTVLIDVEQIAKYFVMHPKLIEEKEKENE